MFELGHNSALIFEKVEDLLKIKNLIGESLERMTSTEHLVLYLIDLAHTSLPQQPKHSVLAKFGAIF